MSTALRIVLTAVCAYLLGSLNFSIIVSKVFLKKDIRDYGSGNAGSTNSMRVMGFRKTALVIVGDVLKGVAAMKLVPVFLGGNTELLAVSQAVAGFAVILGHSFPIFFSFRGGKGVMTTAAVIACLDMTVFFIAITLFIIVVVISKYVSLGSLIAEWSLPVLFWIFRGTAGDGLVFIVFSAVLAAFVTFQHRSNIARLAAGTENKFKFKK